MINSVVILLKRILTSISFLMILAMAIIIVSVFLDYRFLDNNYLRKASFFVVVIGTVLMFRKDIKMGRKKSIEHERGENKFNGGNVDPDANSNWHAKVYGTILICLGAFFASFS